MGYQTRQELFTTAYLGMVKQNWEQSLGPHEECRYRGGGNLKCALGHCIPNKNYSPRLENLGPYDDRVRLALNISEDDVDFAAEMQDCHDLNDTPEKIKEAFHDFAIKWKLEIPKQ